MGASISVYIRLVIGISCYQQLKYRLIGKLAILVIGTTLFHIVPYAC